MQAVANLCEEGGWFRMSEYGRCESVFQPVTSVRLGKCVRAPPAAASQLKCAPAQRFRVPAHTAYVYPGSIKVV